MHEFVGEFVDNRCENIGWSEVVYGLSEGDEDVCDSELMIGEISGMIHRRNMSIATPLQALIKHS